MTVLVEKRSNIKNDGARKEEIFDQPSKFPPDPPSSALLESITKGFCKDTAPENLIEAGCTVCGRLSPIDNMVLLDEINCDLSVISPGDVGRCERLYESDPIAPLKGPILAEDCNYVCP